MIKTTQGPARELLPQNVVDNLSAGGTLIVDERRLRSSFFDGRFLTARDLTREQTYFLTRQADGVGPTQDRGDRGITFLDALNRLHNIMNTVGQPFQFSEIVAEYLDGHLAFYTRYGLLYVV